MSLLTATPGFWNYQEKNHSDTAPNAQVLLGYDSLKYKQNYTTNSPGQKIPPPWKEYIFFQIDGKNARAEYCAKSLLLAKVIDFILEIELFYQQCVILKGSLESEQPKQHMVKIRVE